MTRSGLAVEASEYTFMGHSYLEESTRIRHHDFMRINSGINFSVTYRMRARKISHMQSHDVGY